MLDIKIKSLSYAEPKLVKIWPFLIATKWPEMAILATSGHSGQSDVSENGPNGFTIPKNIGIDTKIKSLACAEPL